MFLLCYQTAKPVTSLLEIKMIRFDDNCSQTCNRLFSLLNNFKSLFVPVCVHQLLFVYKQITNSQFYFYWFEKVFLRKKLHWFWNGFMKISYDRIWNEKLDKRNHALTVWTYLEWNSVASLRNPRPGWVSTTSWTSGTKSSGANRFLRWFLKVRMCIIWAASSWWVPHILRQKSEKAT